MSEGSPRASTRAARRPLTIRARAEGLAQLSDADVVALVVGHATHASGVQLSRAILDCAGGLEGLARAGYGRLAEVPGVGTARALRVVAALEIGRRVQQRRAGPRLSLASPHAVAASFAARIGSLEHEQMWVLSVDGRNRMRGARCVSQGGMHGLAVSAREILGAALADGASAMILVHNHPSGSPEPSGADVEMTHAVARAAEVVGIPLLDHVVVVANGEFVSMHEAGMLES